jgi:hypothetical protein
MLDYFLLSAALALGQTGDVLPGPRLEVPLPAPPPAEEVVPIFTLTPPREEVEPVFTLSAKVAPPDKDAPPAKEAPVAPLEINAPLLPPPPPAPPAPAAPPSPAPDRWFLMKEMQGTWPGMVLDGNRMAIYGWSDFSFTASSVANNNLPESWNYRANEPIMQQTWLRIARSVVTSGTTEPTFGFQSDWIYGTDYRFTLPQRGIWVEQLAERHGLPNIYGVDPVQFYGEAFFPTIGRGLDVKVGRMYCLYGVESIESVSTPLVSHAYIFNNGSPFTHTGAMATLALTPVWQVQAMGVVGSDLFIDPADEPTFSGSIQWTQPGGRNLVKASTVLGPGRFDVERAVHHINVFDMVWTHNFSPVMVSYLEALFGYETNLPDAADANGNPIHLGTTTWAGVAGYLTYTFSPHLAGTVRLELFDDPQGVRTNTAPGATVEDAKGLYTALTAGLIYKCRKGLIFRPELRYDYNGESHPFEGNHGLLTAAADVILRW